MVSVTVFLSCNLSPHGWQNALPSVLCSSSFPVPCLNKSCLFNTSFGILRKWGQKQKIKHCHITTLLQLRFFVCLPYYWHNVDTRYVVICSQVHKKSLLQLESCYKILCWICVKLNCSVFWDCSTKDALSRTEVPFVTLKIYSIAWRKCKCSLWMECKKLLWLTNFIK
jgi:hypothetical protein